MRTRKKDVDKHYIYDREKGKCFHCGKPILRHKMTLDHYYPRSLGGTYDLFNIVCCCKKCNKLKRSSIPEDHEAVNIALFKQAIKDRRISISGLGKTYDEIIALAEGINRMIRNRENIIFEAPGIRFYVRENRILKIVHYHVADTVMDIL